ncbi:hypothetical protein CK203_006235 [Vitis vinifera]|uniref:Reverse transcriptase/retrotransposon-derived protein RNase H-like domain-containing protein n=1 Tax=Vitis vinifera TaxID=29760 RepID=A0A438K5P2_VITVI|nr:hypothetical protein CK203_006235 [Vitis vinifera]
MEQTTLALKSVAQKLALTFKPIRLAIKGQVMVDFIAEIPQKSSQLVRPSEEGWWILHVDGASRVSGSGVGLLLQSPTKEQLE